MLENLIFITNVVLPVFILVIIGLFLRLIKIVDDNFVNITSIFVFKISLPVMIFLKLSNVDLERTFDFDMTSIVLICILLTYLISYAGAKYGLRLNAKDEGVFIQGAFRSNYAIVGLAIIFRMFGMDAVAKASFILLFVLPLYNLLSVVALTLPFNKSKKLDVKKISIDIISNPLIIAVLLAIPFSLFKIKLYPTLEESATYIADIALPLALIGIGGSLNMKSVRQASKNAFYSTLIKNIISPFLAFVIAYQYGFSGDDLGIIVIIFASPTAIASFAMAAGMKGNIKLAGNIIIISTISSVFVIIAGLFLLKLYQFI